MIGRCLLAAETGEGPMVQINVPEIYNKYAIDDTGYVFASNVPGSDRLAPC